VVGAVNFDGDRWVFRDLEVEMDEQILEVIENKRLDVLYDEAKSINKLVDLGLIKPQEIVKAGERQMTELAQRAGQIAYIFKMDGEQKGRNKVEVMMGLGNEKNKVSRLEMVIRSFAYAVYLKSKFPDDVAGIILFGSRTKPEKTPLPDSDQDMLLVVKPEKLSGVELSLDLVPTIERTAKTFLGTEADLGVFYSCDLKNRQNESSRASIGEMYKKIDKDSVVMILDGSIRKSFFDVFSANLKRKQEDFNPTIAELFFH
jgi:hypothetical protein